MKYDIFVSYRRSDRELVASVVRRLEARGVGVWYDADIEGGADWRETRNTHPVVRTNPETGRIILFVNKSYTVGFEGMTEAESKQAITDFRTSMMAKMEAKQKADGEKNTVAGTAFLAANAKKDDLGHLN